MAKKGKAENGKFFGAIARDCEVKVGPTEEEVEEYFQNREGVLREREKLVWFEGSVDKEKNSFSFKLSDDEPCFELENVHQKRITIEVTFYVAGIYGVGRKKIPETIKDSILKLFKKKK